MTCSLKTGSLEETGEPFVATLATPRESARRMPSPSDEDLMAATGRGDLQSFGEIVLRHQALAWRVAYRCLGDRTEAEDIAQQAFLKVLEAAPRYQPTARFSTYLYGVVTRLCLDHIRKNRPMTVEDLRDVPSPPLRTDGPSVAERDEAIRKALDGLPANQRTAIVLRHYEELSYRDIASILETSEKAVERLLSRARGALEGHLAGVIEG